MTLHFKITRPELDRVRRDLARPHAFAFERVGFLGARVGRLPDRGLVFLASEYRAVADEDYIDDMGFGALIGPNAIRAAMQWTLSEPICLFHVHAHPGRGFPRFSPLDERELRRLVPDFFNVRPTLPHGALVLGDDAVGGYVWPARGRGPFSLSRVVVVGHPLQRFGGPHE